MSLDFEHIYRPGMHPKAWTLILLHETGGDENDLIPVGHDIMREAALLSPRGRICEHGANRYFRSIAEGILDIEDWRMRSSELADFLLAASKKYNFDLKQAFAVGFSNGANIATGLLLLRPEVLNGAILLRPMFVSDVDPKLPLNGKQVLILSGAHDPLLPPGDTERLSDQFFQAGANVTVIDQHAGHNLNSDDIARVRDWLIFRTLSSLPAS